MKKNSRRERLVRYIQCITGNFFEISRKVHILKRKIELSGCIRFYSKGNYGRDWYDEKLEKNDKALVILSLTACRWDIIDTGSGSSAWNLTWNTRVFDLIATRRLIQFRW